MILWCTWRIIQHVHYFSGCVVEREGKQEHCTTDPSNLRYQWLIPLSLYVYRARCVFTCDLDVEIIARRSLWERWISSFSRTRNEKRTSGEEILIGIRYGIRSSRAPGTQNFMRGLNCGNVRMNSQHSCWALLVFDVFGIASKSAIG